MLQNVNHQKPLQEQNKCLEENLERIKQRIVVFSGNRRR